MKSFLAVALLATTAPAFAAIPLATIESGAQALQPQVVSWRRHIHQHPELGNREVNTATLVAKHLKSLGLEVREQVGKTGVVAVLRGGMPGGTVALRADMDALPVKEATGLPFASTATGLWNGATVPVAHACGHDAHVAMLLGAASLLTSLKADIPGTIVFIFQPAEEGPPPGEEGGAKLMLKEGALANPRPDAIFGLHVWPGRAGTLSWRPKGMMAESRQLKISINGAQTHGAQPWRGIDVISQTATTVQELNRLTARTIDPTQTPTILTIATINAGLRHNIIPENVELAGTMRTFDPEQRDRLMADVTRTVDAIATAYGSRVKTEFIHAGPLTWNEPALAAWLEGPLAEAAGGRQNIDPAIPPVTPSEDVSVFMEQVGGVYYFLGINPPGKAVKDTPPNHSPYFTVNEDALPVGVKAHALSAIRFLEQSPAREAK